MKVSKCFHRKILNPCNLEMYNHQVDPYIGCEHSCYYCYAQNNAETDWEKEILIHGDLIERLSQSLSNIESETIYIGMDTDPYQPSEVAYKQTRKILELFADRDFSACILTKSGLVSRDIDLLTQMPKPSVGISIAFQDEKTRVLFEKSAPSNKERIEALKKLKKAGIETYTLISPVMPFITDVGSLIEEISPYSDTVWIYGLQVESEEGINWRKVQSILNHHFPELTKQYRKIAFSKEHSYWKGIRHTIEKIQGNIRIEL